MEDSPSQETRITGGKADEMRLLQSAVLRALAYFDIFDHPLRVKEITQFAVGNALCEKEVELVLYHLAQEGVVKHTGAYWGLGDVMRSVTKRQNAESRAQARMPKAVQMSKRIARFPFVRAVFISGSMSKGCLAPDGDIDFFVVTVPGRLWVARTLLVLYKKIFLLNSRRDFCVNYFLDTEHLTVEDRNRFTATEVITLMPMYGNGTTEAFFERNAWAFQMYPGAAVPQSREVMIGSARGKVWLERSLNGRVGETLDRWSMHLTWYYWKRKFSELDAQSFELALRTRTYVSKHHPRNFQKRVLDGYHERVEAMEQRTGISLT